MLNHVLSHTQPYSSTRLPVFAHNIVSTAHTLALAAQAGVRMLQCGGNGVDAASPPKRGTDSVTVRVAGWRMGDPAVEGYMAASDLRRDGQAAGY